jgi:hypothetical protein
VTARTFTLTVTAQQPQDVRRSGLGHYIAIGNDDNRRTTYWKTVSASAPNLLAITGMQGAQLRYPWRDLEGAQGVYTFGSVLTSYPDTDRSIRADLWRCAQNGKRAILFIEDKAFANDPDPMPVYMAGNTNYVLPNENGGFTAVRWNTFVQARFQALLRAILTAFDSNDSLFAIAIPETALGFTSAQLTASGYTATAYRDSIINNLKAASDACTRARILWYQNFFPTPAQDFRLDEVAEALAVYKNGASGVVMGGPDIMPDKDALVTRVYPRYALFHGRLPLFCSMQNDSYSQTENVHTTNSPDPRVPGATWSIGDPWTPAHSVRWSREYLHLSWVIWNRNVGPPYNFEPDGRLVIEAHPTFNPDEAI